MIEWRKDFAEGNTILRGVVGSTALGTALDGTDDRDEMGVCIEPPEYVLGLNHFEQYIYRDQPEGVKSQPGDLDLVIYSLRKYVRLATQGNPSILALLWLPEHIICAPLGERLLSLRDAFVSKESGKRFLGYLRSQKKALNGERSPKVSRPDLVEKFGYDTKFAMHALRLGLQGIEYLTHSRLTLPMPQKERVMLLDLRRGAYELKYVLDAIDDVETRLTELIDRCTLEVDRRRINEFLINAHLEFWKAYEIVA